MIADDEPAVLPPPSLAAAAGPPNGLRSQYVGDVLVNSTGPVSAGWRVQPSKRSVRYACVSAS